ncbi:glutamate-1-semialdehyde 2,1-aminomutase 2 [Asticcacaulis biprosthecium C19]|uniref:Glutamate-1-semialdehyde 2,1-aminomutase 2 n=1 Tax=Asticcacaulis biprosthecium C19 TaxID=715226 RepID=F4QU39_9CAUL|nr:aspartate aminotransferase family protein [Asticcacaulis biprosthecium]EGF89339.1 glutamate-1-semialdehyde 2,1-aminomutase 2 [Asticcacaulis biprosthecium C19]
MTLQDFISQQREVFASAHSLSKALSEQASAWRGGVPMHWMRDWASPFPIFVKSASGATLTDVDGVTYDDFCLGDTPSMFGHARAELTDAIADQAGRGVGYMLPMPLTNVVGDLLRERFAMDQWQVATTASDANRAVIRWARAITGRDRILVFDGCYHGMVEDCFVALYDGVPSNKAGLIGQVHDQTRTTTVVPFNDLPALEAALATGDIAAVLAEPVMTNCGMIRPDAGYLEALRDLCTRRGALLVMDETHTLSSAPGGYCIANGLKPDMFVVGKAIAGGIPAAVWGVTSEVAARMDEAQARIGPGQSGIGTTLSGNALVMRAIHTVLTQIATQPAYDRMLSGAEYLVAGLDRVTADLPWCTVHVGARVELVFAPERPRNAQDMRRFLDHDLLDAFHLFLINRGVLIAPFHNMMLISPQTQTQAIDRLVDAVDAFGHHYREFS